MFFCACVDEIHRTEQVRIPVIPQDTSVLPWSRMRKGEKNMNKKTYISIVMTGFFISQAVALKALANEEFDEEVYSSAKSETDTTDDPMSEEFGKINIQLTKRGEESDRIAEESYPQVKGSERLMDPNDALGLKIPMQSKTQFNPTSTELQARNQYGESRTIASVANGAHISAKPNSFISTENIPDVQKPDQLQTSNWRPAKQSSDWDSRVIEEPKPVKAGMYQEVSLIVSDSGYYPSRIFVTPNIPVKMYMSTTSKSTLCFMIDNWGVKKGVTPGKVEEIMFIPERPGNYRFYCPVKGIEGTLTVREPQTEQSRNVASSSSANIQEPMKLEPLKQADATQRPEPKKLKMLTDDEE